MSFSALRKNLEDEGFGIAKEFLTEDELRAMRFAVKRLENHRPENINFLFSPDGNQDEDFQYTEDYVMDYNDRFNYYFEARQDTGLITLNKIGHAVHWLDSTLRRITFSGKIRKLCDDIGLLDPVVVDSMILFKRAHLNGEVKPHQDATYISTDPESVVAFWFPLVDMTPDNGCLWIVRQSHKKGLLRKFSRTNDPNVLAQKMVYDRQPVNENQFKFEPIVAHPGDCVLLDSMLLHRNKNNTTDSDRPVYCFRTAEKNTKYSPLNWIQPIGTPFVPIFDHLEKSFDSEID